MKNREIEQKIEILNKDFEDITDIIDVFLDRASYKYSVVKDDGGDYYWSLLNNPEADFLRLREKGPKGPELTIKHKDKGSNFNRLEINMPLGVDILTAETFLYKALGKPSGFVFKTYYVFKIIDQNLEICTYEIKLQDERTRTFIEIEGKKEQSVIDLLKKVEHCLTCNKVEYLLCNKSLYEMYVNKEVI